MRTPEARRKNAIKAFNKLLKDKNIKTIKKEKTGFYCITYKDGAQFRCRGHVVDNALIYTKDWYDKKTDSACMYDTFAVYHHLRDTERI